MRILYLNFYSIFFILLSRLFVVVIGIHNGKIGDSSIIADDQNDDNEGEENSQEYNIIYACGRKKSQAHCNCTHNTLNCGKQLIGRKMLNHANVKVMKHGFKVKTAIFKRNNIQILKKGYILPNDCEDIEELNFNDNKISQIESNAFDDFDSLKKLKLETNMLINVDETILTKKLGKTLEFLDLGSNKLLQSFSLKYLNQLLELHLNFMPLKKLRKTMFPESLANLKSLFLVDCNLTQIVDDAFENLTELKILYLIGNPLTTIPRAINGIPQLQILELSNTHIIEIKTNELSDDHKLQELHINAMNYLTIIGDCAFCGLPNLKTISIWWCKKLSSIHENAFGMLTQKNIPEIEYFALSSTNVSVLPEKLLNWNNLEDFNIIKNPFVCDCSMAWLINDVSLHRFNEIPICASPPKFANMSFTNITGEVCLEEEEEASLLSNKKEWCPYLLILILIILVILIALLIHSSRRFSLKRIFRRSSELPPMIYRNLEAQEQQQRHADDHDDSELQRDF